MRQEDFVEVPAGGQFDPYQRIDMYGFFSAYQMSPQTFKVAGKYRIQFVYSTEENNIKKWLGDGKADDKLLGLFSKVPKTTIRSNEIVVEVVASALSPDSSLVATWVPGKENVVRICDVRTGKEVRSFPETKAGWPGGLFFAADGKMLFVAGLQVVGFDVASGKELFSWPLKPLPSNSGSEAVGARPVDPDDRIAWRTLSVSPDGETVGCILEGVHNRIVLYEARTGKVLPRWNDSGLPAGDFEQLAFSPDSKLLASSDYTLVHIWKVATGKKVSTYEGHRAVIRSLAFSANGRHLVSAGLDGKVLSWDLTEGTEGMPTADLLTEDALERYWMQLAGRDAGLAHQAIWSLAVVHARSIPFLQGRLRPVKGPTRELLDRLVKNLDDVRFDVRQLAMAKLEKLGESAVPALREALQNRPTLEQRRRIEKLLHNLDSHFPSGDSLRALRAVRVLEYAASPEAIDLLQTLTKGDPKARLTHEAKASLERLAKQTTKKP